MRRGFTLIEVMVAAGVLSIGCLGVLAMLLTAIDHNREARDRTLAVTIAEQKLAELEMQAKIGATGQAPLSMINALSTSPGHWSDNVVAYNANGVVDTSANKDTLNRFAVRYIVLKPSADYPANSVLRGGIRVVWNTTGTAQECAQKAFDTFDTRSTRFSSAGGCGFITMPFALYKENITEN